MKTFKVLDSDGKVMEVEQLATFTHDVQDENFRFVVTRRASHLPLDVTHRISGKRVTSISYTQQAACLNDHIGAARLALKTLCEQHGEARVRSVLAAADHQPLKG